MTGIELKYVTMAHLEHYEQFGYVVLRGNDMVRRPGAARQSRCKIRFTDVSMVRAAFTGHAVECLQ
jgi:hypothetical protein